MPLNIPRWIPAHIHRGLRDLLGYRHVRWGSLVVLGVGIAYWLYWSDCSYRPRAKDKECRVCTMGGFICCECPQKSKPVMGSRSDPAQGTSNGGPTSGPVIQRHLPAEGQRQRRESSNNRQRKDSSGPGRSDEVDRGRHASSSSQTRKRHRTASGGPEQIRHCIMDTLKVIRTLVDNEQEPPYSLLRLHRIAEQDEGWLQMVRIIIDTIPLDDALGPAVINLLLDECPIPTKETIAHMCASQGVDSTGWNEAERWQKKHRNICVVLGCLADKMAGAGSITLLSDDVLKYLIKIIDKFKSVPASVILFSIIALEKFAQTSENKARILQAIHKQPYLEALEKWWRKQRLRGLTRSEDYLRWQVGFCAQWSLDNLFVKEGRKFCYEREDMSHINVMLNSHDVSEYLKLSPNGLVARCDAPSFESVRCTYQVSQGIWYYEVIIITSGVMQIGWATKDSKFLNHDGYGIGDDEYSIAYDGCRQLLWYNARSKPLELHRAWQPGDVLGLLLDLEKKEVVFSLNGECLPPDTNLFLNTHRHGFFAAASFMSYQQCQFNFGAEKFRYPPADVEYQEFNSNATMSVEEKVILPRHKRLEMLREVQVQEDSCNLCFDGEATVTLLPCKHRGMCMRCALQLETCPMCRVPIEKRDENS